MLPQADLDRCLWRPSANVATVRNVAARWYADEVDEATTPLPEATIGWLMWHIEWWWTNTGRAVAGEPLVMPADQPWSGSTDGLVAAKRAWDNTLATADLEGAVTGLMPTPQPFAFVAAWVNFELTKINQLLIRQANAS